VFDWRDRRCHQLRTLCLLPGAEDTKGYMLMLKAITLQHGIPLALYHDRHSIFEVARDTEPGLEEQLAGSKP